VELLIDDGLDEGFEGRETARYAHGVGASALDELAEFGVGAGEVGDGGGDVVARCAWSSTGTRHEDDVIRG
jgi:hypothetical protein